ncbi:MAG: translation elongation factor Ts [Bdellovibrionales bacterium]
MTITAELVKELRETSGAGMMDCKKALVETNGNLEEAVDWLRKKGLSAAAKKASRVAAEGLVGVAAHGGSGVVVEVNAETDFIAKNEHFQQLAQHAAQKALANRTADIAELAATKLDSGETIQETLTKLIATIGENMNLRRVTLLSVEPGIVASYVHNAAAPNVGKIGVLVALESTAPADKLHALGKQIAMHIAAARPEALTIADVNQANVERERAVLTEQAAATGKAPEMVAKMVDGRIRKYYEEVVLTEQTFVVDGERKISKVIEDASKEFGAPVKLVAFARFQLGEGIEKEQSDFAAEVAAQAGLKAS